MTGDEKMVKRVLAGERRQKRCTVSQGKRKNTRRKERTCRDSEKERKTGEEKDCERKQK